MHYFTFVMLTKILILVALVLPSWSSASNATLQDVAEIASTTVVTAAFPPAPPNKRYVAYFISWGIYGRNFQVLANACSWNHPL